MITLVITICMCASFSVCAYASTTKVEVKNNLEIYRDPLHNTKGSIIKSEVFIPDESGNLILSPNVDTRAVVPSYYGQVRVDKSNSGDSGISDTDKKTGTYSTIKYASMKILPYLPGVGQIASTVVDIYDGIKAVYTDISNLDTGKTATVYTRYVYRYDYLSGYVWDYSDSWKFYGQSTSKAYYKVQTIDCIVNGSFKTRTLECTAGRGYNPTAVQKAAHYNDTSGLSKIFYEHWKTGIGPYYETY